MFSQNITISFLAAIGHRHRAMEWNFAHFLVGPLSVRPKNHYTPREEHPSIMCRFRDTKVMPPRF